MSDHIPTLADLCSAIAEGHLVAVTDGSTYQVNALELRRYFAKRRALSAISFVHVLSATYAEAGEWLNTSMCNPGH